MIYNGLTNLVHAKSTSEFRLTLDPVISINQFI